MLLTLIILLVRVREKGTLKNKQLLVLGGGTAGWLTALYLKKVFPFYTTTLIESKEIGIIGVGEATTPNIVTFLKYLNIDVFDLIQKTKGSIKNGISFENWNGDNKKYFHEAGLLKLNCDKALNDLNWLPTLKFGETVQMTIEWYKEYYQNADKLNNSNMFEFSVSQIKEYHKLATQRDLSWAKTLD